LEVALPEVVVDIWSRYQREVWMLGIASAAMLVISAILIPFLIVRLPADFYAGEDHRRRLFENKPLVRTIFLTVKNTIGGFLLVAGIAMLLLPGQGIFTILAALAMLDFPGKRDLEMRILHRRAVMRTINWLRLRAGREPLSL
jgi:uncharacterized membrane protein SpoIIM required for sporulation